VKDAHSEGETSGGNCHEAMFGGDGVGVTVGVNVWEWNVWTSIQNYKSLCVAVMIYNTLVNTQTDRHTDSF